MKKVKLLSCICTLGSLTSGTALFATSCAKKDDEEQPNIEIAAGNNSVWDNKTNALTVANVGEDADAAISLTGRKGISFKLSSAVDGLDIVDGSATNVKDKLIISSSFRTNCIGKEITIVQRDGDGVIKITIAAVASSNVNINIPAMVGSKAVDANQCSYDNASSSIVVNKNVSFGNEETPKYISIYLILDNEAQMLDPQTDLVAFFGPEQIHDATFEWTNPLDNYFKSITLKLAGSLYKSFGFWEASKITVKANDSYQESKIEPITFNIIKDHYIIDSADAGSDNWSEGQGGYISASLNPESPYYGTWIGLDEKETAKKLKITIPSDQLWTLSTIANWSGKIGLDDTEGLEVVTNGSQPTKANKAYIQLPSSSMATNTVEFVIPNLEAFPSNDEIVYITAEDDSGHLAAIAFKVEHATSKCRLLATKSEECEDIAIGQIYDIHKLGWKWDYDDDLSFSGLNGVEPTYWQMYIFTGVSLTPITLNSDKHSFHITYNGDSMAYIGVDPNKITMLNSSQIIVLGYDENNNIVVKHFFVLYIRIFN